MPATPPSGFQVELVLGAQRAVVVEVGGGLREYTVDGRPVLDGYAEDEMASGGRGQTMMPWPNRIDGGRYEFDGAALQLPLSEVERHNAIHGLTRWSAWGLLERTEARAVLGHQLHPQPGYPFALDCRLEYELTADGLTVRASATNTGDRPCPYGAGHHPYLTVGTDSIEDTVLTAPAARYLPTDDRGIPTGVQPVDGTPYDLRDGRPLGGATIDHSFTELARDPAGLAWVTLRGGGRAVRLWQDEGYPYLQVFTGDTLSADRRRRGLGVEPMTCAPNAFRTGVDLTVLTPGDSTAATWGITPG